MTDPERDWLRSDRSAELRAVGGFAVCVLGAIGFATAYSLALGTQALAVTLGASLLGLGYGLATLGREVLHDGPHVEERQPMPSEQDARTAVEGDFDRARRSTSPTRRRLVSGALATAGTALGLSLLFPVRSFGPRPGSALRRTPWAEGVRVVDQSGAPVAADDVDEGAFLTVFPEGHVGSFDGQAVLMRVDPGLLRRLDPSRGGWSPDGLICFSKVCTHAGCPVGEYQVETHQLVCPCHQSAFDVLEGAKPVFGPAAVALPQLPLRINDDGVLEAQDDFPVPIGPGFWSRP